MSTQPPSTPGQPHQAAARPTRVTVTADVSSPPLEATRQRVVEVFRAFAFELNPAADAQATWTTVAAAGHPDNLAGRMELLATRFDGHRDVAAAWVAMRAAAVVAGPLIGMYVLERRVPLLDPTTTQVATDDALEFRQLALGTTRVAGLASDPAASHPDLTVVDHDTLGDTLVDIIERHLRPLLDHLRPLAPFGRRGLWGLTADAVGGLALAAARETHRDHRPAWAAANEVLDRLQTRGNPVNNRPRALVVTCEGREFPFNIHGTCCLRYKADAPGDRHDPEFGAYCHSCPLIDNDTLTRHYLDNARERLQVSSG